MVFNWNLIIIMFIVRILFVRVYLSVFLYSSLHPPALIKFPFYPILRLFIISPQDRSSLSKGSIYVPLKMIIFSINLFEVTPQRCQIHHLIQAL